MMAKEDTFTENEAIELLRKYSHGNENNLTKVYEHSLAVKKLALKTCEQLRSEIEIDRHLISIGSLLHDIGRFDHPPGKETIKHGVKGAEILRKEDLPKCADIAERHTGIGITREDILKQKLPLPLKDLVPRTREEKIICYADNRIKGTQEKDEEYVVERFSEELGEEYETRVLKFHQEINSWKKSSER